MEPLLPTDPEFVGEYELECRLGAGAMGVVYKAWNSVGVPVAVKVISARHLQDPKYRDRFAVEVEAAKRVPRYCTAPVLDSSVEGDDPYVVTEFISGPTLEKDLEDGPLVGSALDGVAVGIAAALRAIHQSGVVHRDLKPSNILISPYGPRVIDFGLATLVDAARRLTSSGAVIGTARFMAPEQSEGAAVDARADIYSWAVSVVYAASGRFPKGPRTPSSKPEDHDSESMGLSGTLYEVVVRALNWEPRLRPTAADIVDELANLSPKVLASAIDSGARSRSSRPRTADQWAARAAVSLADDKARLALFDAERGIQLDPDSSKCWYQKGRAQIRLGYQEEGEDSLRLAYEMDSNNPEIRSGFTTALAESPRPEAKMQAFSIAPNSDLVKRAYLEHLIGSDSGQLLVDFVMQCDDPAILERYVQWAIRRLLELEVEIRNEQAEYTRLAGMSRREIRSSDANRDLGEEVRQARRRTELAASRANQLASEAYQVAPDDEDIASAYLASLIRQGQRKALVQMYRSVRRSHHMVVSIVAEVLDSGDCRLAMRLTQGVSRDEEEVVALAQALVRVVGHNPPADMLWRGAPAKQIHKAKSIEIIADVIIEKLKFYEGNDVSDLDSDVRKVRDQAFGSSGDKEVFGRTSVPVLVLIVVLMVVIGAAGFLSPLFGAEPWTPWWAVVGLGGGVLALLLLWRYFKVASIVARRRRKWLRWLAESDAGGLIVQTHAMPVFENSERPMVIEVSEGDEARDT